MQKLYNLIRRLNTTYRQASLRGKLMTIVMTISSFVLVFTCGAFMLYYAIESRNALVRELTMLGNFIGNRSAAALSFADPEQARQNLEALTIHPSINMACMYDATGELFSAFQRGPHSDSDTCPEHPQLGYFFSPNSLTVYQDIYFKTDEKLGSIYLRSDLKQIRAQLFRYAIFVIIFLSIGYIVSYILSNWLQRAITGPLDNLVNAAQDVKEHHNYRVRVAKTTEDELGVLVDAFNDMLSQIQSNQEALRNSNEVLELRVIERTRDLEKAKEHAEAANLAKSDFLANMSHELRTPMHAILSFAGFGIDEIDDQNNRDEQLKYFTRIKDSGSRLLSLLNNLLDLSKLEAGKMDFTMKKEDLQKSTKLVLGELQMLLKQKEIEVNHITPDFETTAVFDYGKIIQVIYNLLSNAIKFTPKGKSVTIRYEQAEVKLPDGEIVPGIAFKVRDEGLGIPESELATVFDKFIQSSKTKTGAGGTGLGLAICKEIIDEHQGHIWAENNPEGGAKFTFTLPITHKMKPEPQQKVTESSESETSNHVGPEKNVRTGTEK